MTVNKLQLPAKDNAVQLKINEIIDNLGGGGATDVQINGTSITSNNVANILTNSAYGTNNKIATMNDLSDEIFVATYGTTTYTEIQTAFNAGKAIFCKKDTSKSLGVLKDYETNYFSFFAGQGTGNLEFRVSSSNAWNTYTYNYLTSSSSEVASSRFDGQWTVPTSYKYIANAVTINSNATYTSNISSALPSDTNKYIVVISGWGYTATSSGNTANIYVTTDLSSSFSDAWMLAKAKTQAGNAQHWGGSATVVVGTGRTIYIKNTGTGKTTDATVWISAYRRVGTNS